jgi:hypothetical protein
MGNKTKNALPQNSLFGSLKIHRDIPRYGLNRCVESIQSISGSRQTGSHSDKPARNSDFCGIAYILSIKSGPNRGNNSQLKRMKDNFKKAQRILRTSNSKANIQAVCGCCYGRDNQPNKGDYWKLCGQEFWEFISGNDLLYIEIIEPLGYRAKERNQEFTEEYGRILNLFTNEFFQDFCIDGNINWKSLVQFNSGKKQRRGKNEVFTLTPNKVAHQKISK